MTRMPSGPNSDAITRTTERSAALVATYMVVLGRPIWIIAEVLKITLDPWESRGSAFCTVKKAPLTLVPNI